MSIQDIARSNTGAWKAHWDAIRQASANRKLLLVEGDDDKAVVEQLLDSIDPLWPQAVHVGAAGDRGKVLSKLRQDPRIFGLVDRDVWDEKDVFERITGTPNLVVTSGWCMENHLCVPADLESALSLSAGELSSHLLARLEAWLSHGAIWWTLQRLRERIGAAVPSIDFGHPEKDPCDAVTDETKLRGRLAPYDALVSSCGMDVVIRDIQARRRQMGSLPNDARIERGIHGKLFFIEEIAPLLSKRLGQSPASQWRNMVARSWAPRWPDYLIRFAEKLLS